MTLRNLFFYSIFVFITTCSCNNKSDSRQTDIVKEKNDSVSVLSNKIYKSDNGFGYDILIDGKIYIHQPYIPGISGRNPFPTYEKALKTANLVCRKMASGFEFPAITPTELDSLGVLKQD